jgi:hypothetical protein
MVRAYVHGNAGLVYPVDVTPELTVASLFKQLSISGDLKNAYGRILEKSALVESHLVEHNDLYLSTPSSSSITAIPQALTAFSWEDSDEFVTVRLSVKNPENIRCSFQERSFDVLVHSSGQEFRFRCPRTHGLMDPTKCTFRASKNSAVVVKLRKLGGKADGAWFDLFKKKAIGDTDAL